MTDSVCPSCGQQAGPDSRYCHRCGSALEIARSSEETRRTVTLLFCDQTGSTALAESLDPEYVRSVQLRYFQLLTECVERHGGRVEKYIGDAVMAVFGLPTIHEDDALRAVRAALDMRRAVDVLDTEFAGPDWPGFGVRVGVNSGEVIATADPLGNQALVSGDAVNTAARLEQAATRGEILLGQLTHELVRDAVLSEPVPALALKGKSAPVRAWRLIDVRPRAQAVRRRFDTDFHGRRSELSRLRTLFDELRREPGLHLCTIYGEPGIGKSRLAAEFVASVAPLAHVGQGECAPYGDAALTPFALALSDLISSATPESALAVGDSLRSPMTSVIRDGSAGLDPTMAFNAVRKAVAEAGRDKPVLLVIDDLHWASEATLDLIDYLCDQVFGVPVLLLCLARLEFVDRRSQWGGGLAKTNIVLPPLSEEDCARIALGLVDVSAHGSDSLSRVLAACDGNPLFVEQMMEMRRDGEFGSVPATLQTLVAARLDQLDRHHREWLEFAAVLGTDFSPASMAGLIDTPADVNKLIGKRLITHGGADSTFRFGSQLIKSVAYTKMPKRVRAERHVLVARTLERRGEASAAIAPHFQSAYRYQLEVGIATAETEAVGASALRHFLQAGRQAMDRADPHTALPLLEAAVALGSPDPVELWRARVALADVLLAVGDLERAGALLDQTADAPDPAVATHARLQAETLRFISGEPNDLATVASEAMQVFEEAGDSLGLARCHLRLGQVSQLENRFTRAGGHFEQALTLASSSNAHVELPSILGGLALSLWHGAEPASSAVRRCRGLLAEHADGLPVLRAAVNCPLAMLLAMRSELDEARASLMGAEEILGDSGHRAAAAVVPLFAGLLETMASRPLQAAAAFQAAREAFDSVGDTVMRDCATLHLARLRFESGEPELAETLFAEYESRSGSAPMIERVLGNGLKARLAATAGRFDSARVTAGAAVELSFLADSPRLRGLALLDQADVYHCADDPLSARDVARLAYTNFQAKEDAVGMKSAAAALESYSAR